MTFQGTKEGEKNESCFSSLNTAFPFRQLFKHHENPHTAEPHDKLLPPGDLVFPEEVGEERERINVHRSSYQY